MNSERSLRVFLLVRLGQIINWLFIITLIQVDVQEEKRDLCKYFINFISKMDVYVILIAVFVLIDKC